MSTLHRRLRRAGLRVCPPCDGNCMQGRDCPAAENLLARNRRLVPDVARAADEAWLSHRSLELDNKDLRTQNALLRNALAGSIVAFILALLSIAALLTKVQL